MSNITQAKRYLPVNVLKHDKYGDCSNGGVTARIPERLVVPCEDGHISEEDVDEHGYVVLELGTIFDSKHFKQAGRKGHTMFGGNFVWSSDSRFSEKYGRQPIHVHDRYER